ncbi:MAG: hypothetical protein V8S34_03335 [Lawsonibacter sp.]
MEEKQLLDKLWETYELSHEAAQAQRMELESVPNANRRIGGAEAGHLRPGQHQPGRGGGVPAGERALYLLTGQRDDVERAKELEGIIAGITREMKTIFAQQFALINETFGQTFVELFGGGKAAGAGGPERRPQLRHRDQGPAPGKALKTITLLSGGEKAFVAIALYFAILKVRPTPFVVMDEIEAALDDNNVVRFAQYLRRMSDKTQFIVITHRRGTMEEADVPCTASPCRSRGSAGC